MTAFCSFITLFCGCQSEKPKDTNGTFTWYLGGSGKDGTNAPAIPVIAKTNTNGGFDWYLGNASTNILATNSLPK